MPKERNGEYKMSEENMARCIREQNDQVHIHFQNMGHICNLANVNNKIEGYIEKCQGKGTLIQALPARINHFFGLTNFPDFSSIFPFCQCSVSMVPTFSGW